MTDVEYRPLNLNQERWDDVVDDSARARASISLHFDAK